MDIFHLATLRKMKGKDSETFQHLFFSLSFFSGMRVRVFLLITTLSLGDLLCKMRSSLLTSPCAGS